jgi:hypothetical protein
MRQPMLLLAFGVAILNFHTRLAHLETDVPLLAALRTADVDLVHRDIVIDYTCYIMFPRERSPLVPPNLFRINVPNASSNGALEACPWLSRDEASDALRNANGNVERAIEAVTAANAARKRQSSTTTTPTTGDDTIAEEKKRNNDDNDDDRKGKQDVATTSTTSSSFQHPPLRQHDDLAVALRIPPRHTSVPINNLSDRQYCCVWSVEVYEDGYRPDVARALLAKVARHVNPILRARGWRVKRLIESSSSSWIGLCTANGRNDADAASTNIQLNLRIRPDRKCTQFRSFHQILSVMLHEITHTSIGLEDIHPPAFWELLAEIKVEYQTRLTDGEVECETDMYGCDANYINSAGEVASVAASASDIVGTNRVFKNLNLLDKVGSEGDCGSSKRRRRRQKRGGGGARKKGGAHNSGYTSNIPKKRPLLKGSKMVDKRTKVGKAALIKRDNLSVRELAAKAALARFGNAPTTTSVATASSTNIGALTVTIVDIEGGR